MINKKACTPLYLPTYLTFSHVILKTSWTMPRNKGKYIYTNMYTYTNYGNQTNMLITVNAFLCGIYK